MHSYPLMQTCRLVRSEFLPLCEDVARSPHVIEIEVVEFDFSLLNRYVRDIYRRTPALVKVLVTIRLPGSPIGLPLPATAQLWKLQDFIKSTVSSSPTAATHSDEATPDPYSTNARPVQRLESTMQFKLDVNRTIYTCEALEELIEEIIRTFAGSLESKVAVGVGRAVVQSLYVAGSCERDQRPHGTNSLEERDMIPVALEGKRGVPGGTRSLRPLGSSFDYIRRHQAANRQ